MTATTLTPPEALTTREAADVLGVSPATVRRFADRGVLPASRLTPFSPRRFRREDVERLREAADAA